MYGESTWQLLVHGLSYLWDDDFGLWSDDRGGRLVEQNGSTFKCV